MLPSTTKLYFNFMSHRLLDILAGHKDRKGLSGVVLINGENQPVNFKCKSAYVVQVNVTKQYMVSSYT